MLSRYWPVLFCLLACGLRDASAKAWPQPALAGLSIPTTSRSTELVLTFDDGPNPTNTPKVLDILREHHLKAVFFLVGRMVDNPEVQPILQRMVREGHVVANHTMRHGNLCRLETDQEAIDDLDGGERAIEKATHVDVGWVRIPYGARCERVERLLAERHMHHFHWDLDPQEWKYRSVDRAVKYVTRALTKAAGGRIVLLMHDTHATTVRALPKILEYIEEENTRRDILGMPPIRIVSAPELAAEQLPHDLTDWLDDMSSEVRAFPDRVAGLLP